jgi:hypothetical protein
MVPEKMDSIPATSLTALQRLGYILEEVLDEKPLADAVWDVLQSRTFFQIPLNPSDDKSSCPISKRWKVAINIDLESEL